MESCRLSSDVLSDVADELSADILTLSPNNSVRTVPGSPIAMKQQNEFLDEFDTIELKPNTLGRGIGHEHITRLDADPELDRRKSAQVMLMHSVKWSWLKAWAMKIARHRGRNKAIVALARRLAVIMHRIWIDGTEFRWTREAAAA